MTDENFLLEQMRQHGVKPTAVRLLILRAMYRGGEMVSMGDLGRILPTVDKSTISRTLSLFMLHRLIHAVDDGSGALKYNVGGGDDGGAPEEEHTHFYCEKCHRTFCLEQINVPRVELPDGFRLTGINYVLKGVCPECAG